MDRREQQVRVDHGHGRAAAEPASGTVTYNVAARTASSPRTGTLTIAGQTLTVTQSGPCSFCDYTERANGRRLVDRFNNRRDDDHRLCLDRREGQCVLDYGDERREWNGERAQRSVTPWPRIPRPVRAPER